MPEMTREKQIEVLRKLNDDIDQLLSEAKDCKDIAPDLNNVLEIALAIAEIELQSETGKFSCGHSDLRWQSRGLQGKAQYCACCDFVAKIERHAKHVAKEA